MPKKLDTKSTYNLDCGTVFFYLKQLPLVIIFINAIVIIRISRIFNLFTGNGKYFQ